MTHETQPYHIPVLLDETVSLLVHRTDGVYVDGTLGGGGHSAGILRMLDARGRLLGIDQDPEAILYAQQRFADDRRMTAVHANAVDIRSILHHFKIAAIDGFLLDLGVSSRHFDSAERGFSFQSDGPLDMRMNTTTTVTAADLLQSHSADDLARIIGEYGEERRARVIARAIVAERARSPLRTTAQLADVIRRCVPPHHAGKTLARVFQAIRIAVNDELEILRRVLDEAFDLLALGGRFAVISYHSLEDRIVKMFLRYEAASCVCPPRVPVCTCGKIQRVRILTPSSIRPDETEVRRNPRARSASLRAGEKIHA